MRTGREGRENAQPLGHRAPYALTEALPGGLRGELSAYVCEQGRGRNLHGLPQPRLARRPLESAVLGRSQPRALFRMYRYVKPTDAVG